MTGVGISFSKVVDPANHMIRAVPCSRMFSVEILQFGVQLNCGTNPEPTASCTGSVHAPGSVPAEQAEIMISAVTPMSVL